MTRLFKRTIFFSACISVLLGMFTNAFAQQERERSAKKARDAASQSAKAARVFDQIMGTRERSIPRDLLDRAEAVAVFPNVIKAGFIVGGRGGRGVISRRVTGGLGGGAIFSARAGRIRFAIKAPSYEVSF